MIPRNWYPYKRESGEASEFEEPYVIPYEGKIKKYLKEDEFIKFATKKEGETPTQENGRVAFLISYYCNGANAADFLRFKFRDIHDDFIVFYREKIKNASKSDRIPIKIYLSAELWDLIVKYGNPPAPDNYIFKCYTDEMTDREKYNARTRFNRLASKSLKQFDIMKHISVRKARHTLVNRLKKNHVDREFVKDILGHTSIITTDNYYDQFEDDTHREIARKSISIGKY